ncbi:MAG: DNA gyrase subunit A [Saprospiraceae bacterium]|uniref:DNA gyrase subunit A n=1 Tax=Candidatus Opimibacter skivensis TaxID=2982028 RepID=A0A9D7SSY0_9BACT|nr:DNA gyrase subunit A [Candidatus Opimibacter skivensis]
MADNLRVIPINIEEELKTAYIDYSMSVIISRALPDVRDGLKPVHRRVLYGMHELGLGYNKTFKKSARIVGEVLGKYHPHGDTAVYDSMVRMAQDWSLRYPLVNPQGNFGSMDGDSPAAMRYTEAKLMRIADELLDDIEKDTVDFQFNFDDSLEEPSVLPAKIPNLLINGSSGIAVGMATNMLPHNLSEVVDGIIATIDNPEITLDELIRHIKAPDFPTGGIIYGVDGIREAYETGRGKVILRGVAEIQEGQHGNDVIIIKEIPYQVNKANLVKAIDELRNEEKVKGISHVQDESSREGIRIVVELKRDAISNVVLSQLYKFTPLQTSYGINNIALVNGRPRTLSLRQLIDEFVTFRLDVIVRRTKFELKKAEDRAHILLGLLIALDNLDEVIKLIRESQDVDEAHAGLVARFGLSDVQAKAILEMRLQRLVGLERQKIQDEYDALLVTIEDFKDILAKEERRKDIIRIELTDIKERYGDPRRTEITFADGEISIEDMIPDEDMVVTISHLGYVKRTNISEYRIQGRGGRGSQGSKTRDEDFIEHMFIASAHNHLFLLSEQGIFYKIRVYEIPEASKTSQGRVIHNLIELPKEDKIKAFIIIKDIEDKEFNNSHYILFCTKKGTVKKTLVDEYAKSRISKIRAININDGDTLIDARLTDGNSEIVIANKRGYAVRFNEKDVREMGRTATGVRGMKLHDDNDEMVGMLTISENDKASTILVISENGYGKRSELEEYRKTKRGGKGVGTLKVTDKTGQLIAIKAVTESDDLMIINQSGVTIRTPIADIRVMGRKTQGVRLINLVDDAIADVGIIKNEENGQSTDAAKSEEE